MWVINRAVHQQVINRGLSCRVKLHVRHTCLISWVGFHRVVRMAGRILEVYMSVHTLIWLQ